MQHKHRCTQCSCVWAHDRADFKTNAEFHKGHECPVCGTDERWKYYGPEEPHTPEEIKRMKEEILVMD